MFFFILSSRRVWLYERKRVLLSESLEHLLYPIHILHTSLKYSVNQAPNFLNLTPCVIVFKNLAVFKSDFAALTFNSLTGPAL